MDFKFGGQVNHSMSQPADDQIVPERGVVRVMWPILEFCTPFNIFGTAKARVVKFCVIAGYIKS